MGPGQTVFTRKPMGVSSSAAVRASPLTAHSFGILFRSGLDSVLHLPLRLNRQISLGLLDKGEHANKLDPDAYLLILAGKIRQQSSLMDLPDFSALLGRNV